jgi:hypothetical protein
MTSNKFLKISSLLDFCLFDCCHLSPRLRIQWRRWDSNSLIYLDAILYLKREMSHGDKGGMSQERLERVGMGSFLCVFICKPMGILGL